MLAVRWAGALHELLPAQDWRQPEGGPEHDEPRVHEVIEQLPVVAERGRHREHGCHGFRRGRCELRDELRRVRGRVHLVQRWGKLAEGAIQVRSKFRPDFVRFVQHAEHVRDVRLLRQHERQEEVKPGVRGLGCHELLIEVH